jgi:hypothetical protein
VENGMILDVEILDLPQKKKKLHKEPKQLYIYFINSTVFNGEIREGGICKTHAISEKQTRIFNQESLKNTFYET